MLDEKFQYPQMDIPANVFRRIPFIYELPKADAAVSQAWVSATLAVIDAPFKPDLQPLDHDEEVFAYYGYYPDFHPRLSRFCHLDRAAAQEQTQSLMRRIRRLPATMTDFWMRMYQSQISGRQSPIDGLMAQLHGRAAGDTPCCGAVLSLPEILHEPRK